MSGAEPAMFDDDGSSHDAHSFCSPWTLADVTACQIPLPVLTEPHRIVASVDEHMLLCDQLETLLTTQKTDSLRLLEAFLDEALAPLN